MLRPRPRLAPGPPPLRHPARGLARPERGRLAAAAPNSETGADPRAQPTASTTPAPTPTVGPSTPRPDYTALDARPLSRLITALFRARMVAVLGADVAEGGYDGIVALTRALNARPPSATRAATRTILASLFPPGLPGAFGALIAKPFPVAAARLNAAATAAACEWLMGECTVNDGGPAAHAAGLAYPGTGVLVSRCRYLESVGSGAPGSGCVSACLNSCRRPTQDFFAADMGLPLTMTPDFATFECQFSFGVAPPVEEDDPVLAGRPACFADCPSELRCGGGGGGCPGAAPQPCAAEFCGKQG